MVAKNYRYKDFNVVCDICGRSFRTPQGYRGHMRFSNCGREALPAGPESDASPAGPGDNVSPEQPSPVVPPSASNKQLREQVERMRLEGELRRYGIAPEPPSTIAQLKEMLALARELGGQQKDGSPLVRMAEEAAALDKIRGIKQGGGIVDQAREILSLLGIIGVNGDDVKSWISQLVNPKRVSTNGLEFEGWKLPPDLSDSSFQKILDYRRVTDAAKIEADSRARMAASWDGMVRVLTPLVAERLGGGANSTGATGVDSKKAIQPPEPLVVICEDCGGKIELTGGDALPGAIVKCPGCGCEYDIRAGSLPSPPKPTKKSKLIKVKSEPREFLCGCGQKLIFGPEKGVGSRVVCPICGLEGVISSPDTGVPVLEPEREAQPWQ